MQQPRGEMQGEVAEAKGGNRIMMVMAPVMVSVMVPVMAMLPVMMGL